MTMCFSLPFRPWTPPPDPLVCAVLKFPLKIPCKLESVRAGERDREREREREREQVIAARLLNVSDAVKRA